MRDRSRRGILLLLFAVLAFLAALAGLRLGRHFAGPPTTFAPLPAPSMSGEPALMLWAWESPQDLTSLDTSKAGVAFLAREVFAGSSATVRPRFQPLRLAPGTWLMAVVRVETRPGFADTPALRSATAQAIAQAATLPNIRALQVDFDATSSQRAFYTAVLFDLRARLPAGMPLSMTALLSWCTPGGWLATSPPTVDEAVSMFFRLGGPIAERRWPKYASDAAAPLCRSSFGISTDETAPAVQAGQRVYLFHPGAWLPYDLQRINAGGAAALKGTP